MQAEVIAILVWAVGVCMVFWLTYQGGIIAVTNPLLWLMLALVGVTLTIVGAVLVLQSSLPYLVAGWAEIQSKLR